MRKSLIQLLVCRSSQLRLAVMDAGFGIKRVRGEFDREWKGLIKRT